MTLLQALFSIVSFVTVLHATSGLEYTDNGIAIVGTTELLNVHVTAGTSREDVISYEFASYIAVHFAGFNLPDGDAVVISSPDDKITVSHTYTGRGRDQSGTFIASFIPGNSVTVTYTSVGAPSAGQGYRVTGFSRGYPTMQHESVCGDGDQSLPAKCYAPGTNLSEELPQAYSKAQAVARLLINGTYLCTGWLGGSEGHLFTNRHCFEQEEWALTTDIEFGAESSSCSDQCETQLGCAGKLVATTSMLIADSEDIDYAVVQLPDCVDLSQYGYLQLRASGPVMNESIYVPQHPDGYAKRLVSTVDGGDKTSIRSVGQDGSCGTNQVEHDADTRGGSSGSPLIASSDNLVVAIHHCGGCTNTAIDVLTVLTDLAAKNITIKNLVATEDVRQNSQPVYAQTPCAAQKPMNSTHTGRNHTMPCTHLPKQGSTKTANSTSAVTVTASNSSTSTTIASKSTPFPVATASSSPLATVSALKSTVSPTSADTDTTTKTTSTSALTSASVVTSSKRSMATLDLSAMATASSTPVPSSFLTRSTILSANSTTTVKTTAMADCDSRPASTPASTSITDTVDNVTIVGKLMAALIGVTSSPMSTPGLTTPSPALTMTPASDATPSCMSPTPAPTTSSALTPNPTPAPTAPSSPKPRTASPTPVSSVTSTSKPSPTPMVTVTSIPKPSTPYPTPATIVTSAPVLTTVTNPRTTPAATTVTTSKPTIPAPTPA